jgi:hypothetical protein
MTLYSAAEVLAAIPQTSYLIKIDLTSGFYQIPICSSHAKYYGIFYRQRTYALQRLPMGHPLAPAIVQRLAQHVARHLHQLFEVAMVSYLDDWLIYGENLPVVQIVAAITRFGLTINTQKSVLQPSKALIYLGLHIDVPNHIIQATPQCIQHLLELLAIVPRASRQDLARITGYATWLAWALNWPTFAATHLLQRETYWMRWLHH